MFLGGLANFLQVGIREDEVVALMRREIDRRQIARVGEILIGCPNPDRGGCLRLRVAPANDLIDLVA